MKMESIMKYAFIGIAIILVAVFLFDSEPVQFLSQGEGYAITTEPELHFESADLDGVNVEAPNTIVFEMEPVGYARGYREGGNTDKFTYYRDVVTDVMYICFEEYNKAGMTVMQDPETGLPLTYARYMDLAQGG